MIPITETKNRGGGARNNINTGSTIRIEKNIKRGIKR